MADEIKSPVPIPRESKTVSTPKSESPVAVPWTSPLVEKYRRQYGSGLVAQTYLRQNYLTVDRSLIPDILRLLRDEEQFDYCVDITAVHYPQREKQFDVVWILYSFPRNERVRAKRKMPDGLSNTSRVSFWHSHKWLERD